MLSVENLSVKRQRLLTLQQISLSVESGQTLAVVGESGAGKSTLIQAILGRVRLATGRVTWAGSPVSCCRPALVMQEPRSAFNPRLPFRYSVTEPLHAQRLSLDEGQLHALCHSLHLSPSLLERRPSEVSIGQVQRLGILRALIASPALVLFDEPLSALDAVTQKQTARMIAGLQADVGFTALVVTHDLGYAAAYAEKIAVLRSGRIEELTPSSTFIEQPQTAYGRQLRDAAFALGALGQSS